MNVIVDKRSKFITIRTILWFYKLNNCHYCKCIIVMDHSLVIMIHWLFGHHKWPAHNLAAWRACAPEVLAGSTAYAWPRRSDRRERRWRQPPTCWLVDNRYTDSCTVMIVFENGWLYIVDAWTTDSKNVLIEVSVHPGYGKTARQTGNQLFAVHLFCCLLNSPETRFQVHACCVLLCFISIL